MGKGGGTRGHSISSCTIGSRQIVVSDVASREAGKPLNGLISFFSKNLTPCRFVVVYRRFIAGLTLNNSKNEVEFFFGNYHFILLKFWIFFGDFLDIINQCW